MAEDLAVRVIFHSWCLMCEPRCFGHSLAKTFASEDGHIQVCFLSKKSPAFRIDSFSGLQKHCCHKVVTLEQVVAVFFWLLAQRVESAFRQLLHLLWLAAVDIA